MAGSMKDKLAQHRAKKNKSGSNSPESRVSNVNELLGGTGELDTSVIVDKAKKEGRFVTLSKGALVPDPNQPRKTVDPDALRELQESIESKGQLQPVLISPRNEDGTYTIIAGERRWRAVQSSKTVDTIDAIISSGGTDELSVLLMQVDENNKREQIPAIENALAMQRVVELCKSQGRSQGDAAALLGISKGKLSKHLSLIKAPESVTALSSSGEIQDVEVLYMLAQSAKTDQPGTEALINDWRNDALDVNLRTAVKALANQGTDESRKSERGKSGKAQSEPQKNEGSGGTKSAVFHNVEEVSDGFVVSFQVGKKTVRYRLTPDSLRQLRDKVSENWRS